jgi:thiol-disulfide isomerase/thioredoxin
VRRSARPRIGCGSGLASRGGDGTIAARSSFGPCNLEVGVTAVRTCLLAGGLLLLAACSGSSSAQSCDRIAGVREGVCPTPVEERGEAPTDALPTLDVDGLGDELSLQDLRGRVVVLNFWASWCGPCRVEQPDLNEAFEELPEDEVAFLGVNVSDSEPNARAHWREFEVPYTSLYDPENTYASRFRGIGPRTLPTTVFIDAEGRVAARVFGLVRTSEIIGLADHIASEGQRDD